MKIAIIGAGPSGVNALTGPHMKVMMLKYLK